MIYGNGFGRTEPRDPDYHLGPHIAMGVTPPEGCEEPGSDVFIVGIEVAQHLLAQLKLAAVLHEENAKIDGIVETRSYGAFLFDEDPDRIEERSEFIDTLNIWREPQIITGAQAEKLLSYSEAMLMNWSQWEFRAEGVAFAHATAAHSETPLKVGPFPRGLLLKAANKTR